MDTESQKNRLNASCRRGYATTMPDFQAYILEPTCRNMPAVPKSKTDFINSWQNCTATGKHNILSGTSKTAKWEATQEELLRLHEEIMAQAKKHDRSIGAFGAQWGL